MADRAYPSSPGTPEKQFKGRLARSLLWTFLLLTMIPLTLVAVSGYLRARALLRNQARAQIANAAHIQAQQADNSIRTKVIRLQRIVYRSDFRDELATLLTLRRGSAAFSLARARAIRVFNDIGKQETPPLFSQFFVLTPDGTIHFASIPEWEGVSLASSPHLQTILEHNAQTIALYNLAPLYPNQLVFLTIEQYRLGETEATVVGVSGIDIVSSILKPFTYPIPEAQAYYLLEDSTGGEETLAGFDPYEVGIVIYPLTAEQLSQIHRAFEGLHTHTEPRRIVNASLRYTNVAGKDVLAQAVWLPHLNSGVIVEVPEETILAPLTQLGPFTLGVFIITMLTLAGVLQIGANRLVRPLLELTDITRRFAEGDWQERASIDREDEIGLLAYTFNRMADELSSLYRDLHLRVEERSRQIRIAAEVAQKATATTNPDELIRETPRLIVEHFGYYHAGIFLLDASGRYAVLRSAHSPAAEEMLTRGHKLEVGSRSVIGWVTAYNEPHVVTDVEEDPLHLKNELLPETRSEAGIPIAVGNLVLGALDVQSTEPDAFDDEVILVLQTLANQIAAALQNATLAESTQLNLQELERLYRASQQITRAQTEEEIIEATGRALQDMPFVTAVFAVREGKLECRRLFDPEKKAPPTIPQRLNISPEKVAELLSSGLAVVDLERSSFPKALTNIPRQMGCHTATFIPILHRERLHMLLVLATRRRELMTEALMQPYVNLAGVITTALDKVAAARSTERRLTELEALAAIGQAVSTTTDLQAVFTTLHEQVRQIMGDYTFTVALYNPKDDTIRVPYHYEDGETTSLEPFPVGEGLSSILIRTRQPLMLVEDTEQRARELGAKVVGKPAKSWIGAPMLMAGEPIGALIVQDTEEEHRFTEDDLHFLTAVASEVAGAIHNVTLLEESRKRALQLETAAEIARDISSALNLDELLQKAVTLIRERFEYYHAAVFLIDPLNEYAVIREAIGEAGAKMKRSGHKLGVGSKSIVGYVAGRGEALVVNDTARDATYYANPLTPETRAEAAFPLKVGDRILGVLDVQSTQPHAFTEDIMRTLQILADQLAIAVENSELFAETQEHLAQHRLLHHITTAAASGTTLEEALESAVQGLQVTLGGDRVAILLLDPKDNALVPAATVGYSPDVVKQIRIPVGTGITGWVAAHRQPLRIDDVSQDPRYIEVSPNTRSELAIPLIYRNELLGVLNVESEQPAAYEEHD